MQAGNRAQDGRRRVSARPVTPTAESKGRGRSEAALGLLARNARSCGRGSWCNHHFSGSSQGVCRKEGADAAGGFAGDLEGVRRWTEDA